MIVEHSAFVGYLLPPMTYLRSLCMVLLTGLLLGCEDHDRPVRHYRYINFAEKGSMPSAPAMSRPAMQDGAMPALPPEMQTPPLPLTWQTPSGWSETKGSGMRIVTFSVEGQECTILSFPGDVGGDEANITRWLGQLGAELPASVIRDFTASPRTITTAGGLTCRLFDFADILPEGASASVLAGIIPVEGHTAFVKLMGDAEVLKRQKAVFEALCESIALTP